MATQVGSITTGVGSSSSPTIAQILTTTRNPEVWQHYNLCKRMDNSTKAQCKHCFNFLSSGSNSTLRNHITHPHCEALKTVPKARQSSMARDESVILYNPDVLHKQFTGLVIQQGLPLNHFDNAQMKRVFQNHMQPNYNHVSCTTLKRHCIRRLFGSPLGLVLSKMLRKVFVNFNLEENFLSITLDNASNNTRAIGRLALKYSPPMEGRFYHSRCVAHIINLAVQSGLAVPVIRDGKKPKPEGETRNNWGGTGHAYRVTGR
nr:hypothetical protein [Tanacetum cinerariifolium]